MEFNAVRVYLFLISIDKQLCVLLEASCKCSLFSCWMSPLLLDCVGAFVFHSVVYPLSHSHTAQSSLPMVFPLGTIVACSSTRPGAVQPQKCLWMKLLQVLPSLLREALRIRWPLRCTFIATGNCGRCVRQLRTVLDQRYPAAFG